MEGNSSLEGATSDAPVPLLETIIYNIQPQHQLVGSSLAKYQILAITLHRRLEFHKQCTLMRFTIDY